MDDNKAIVTVIGTIVVGILLLATTVSGCVVQQDTKNTERMKACVTSGHTWVYEPAGGTKDCK